MLDIEVAVMKAREQYEFIDNCIRENYIMFYSLFNVPGEKYFKKEELVRFVRNDIYCTLLFICCENGVSKAEESVLLAAETDFTGVLPEKLYEWLEEFEDTEGQLFPLIALMNYMMLIDTKFRLNGDNSRRVFRALLTLFQLLIEVDEKKGRKKSKRRIVDGLIKTILDTEEAKKLHINLLRPLVNRRSQILENMIQLDKYISDMENDLNRQFALDRIKSGICYIAVKGQDGYRFYPSRFVGYIKNSRVEHELDYYRDGIETNKAISDILHRKPIQNQDMEQEYQKYCSRLGIQANDKGARGIPRKYWALEE